LIIGAFTNLSSIIFSPCFGDYLLDCFFDPLASADGGFRLFLQQRGTSSGRRRKQAFASR
jgi:hypothetical protein